MKTSRKIDNHWSVILIVLVVFFLVIASFVWFTSKRQSPNPVNPPLVVQKPYTKLKEIPSCTGVISLENNIDFKKFKLYEDNYNKFSLLIPETYSLFKGPGDYMSDQQWQKETYKTGIFSASFGLTNNSKKRSPVDSIAVAKNEDICTNSEDCYIKEIARISKFINPSTLCNLNVSINGVQREFIGNFSSDKVTNNSYTLWFAYSDTPKGIIHFSIIESGDTFTPFREMYRKVFESFQYIK